MSNLTREEITEFLDYHLDEEVRDVRILFVPTDVSKENLFEVTNVYSQVRGQQYESVVIVESHNQILAKKLAMSSHEEYETPIGKVPVNDRLRNEFCDEEDDFFIYDGGHHKEMSLYEQLPVMQCAIPDLNVVSLQIGDYDPAIVRELAFVVSDLLSSRNMLLVICCDLPAGKKEELDRVREMILQNNESGLMHYLSSGDKQINGARAFMTGVMVAREWGLEIELFESDSSASITGFATRNIPV